MGTDDAREAERNMVLLISNNLVPAGFLTLEPTLNDGGPFQDPGFSIPAPQTDGNIGGGGGALGDVVREMRCTCA